MRMMLVLSVLLVGATGCVALKPYEKEYLLNPAMDDEHLNAVDATLMISASTTYEKLGKGGAGAGGGSACPTCGG